MDSHAQYEIRQYANVIGNEIVSKWVPMVWEAFLDYRLNGIALSQIEVGLLALLYAGKQDEMTTQLLEMGWIKKQEPFFKLSREAEEFSVKTKKMGIDLLAAVTEK